MLFKLSYKERRVLLLLVSLLVIGFIYRYLKKEFSLPVVEIKKESKRECININRAPLSELMKLPFIGEKTAQIIIEERSKKAFNSLEDLLRVKGIGRKKLKKLKDFICFD